MTEQTKSLWERESAIREVYHKHYMRRTKRWIIASVLALGAAVTSKVTNQNFYVDRPAVLAYTETNRHLSYLKNYQQNTQSISQSIPSLDQLLPENAPFYTSLETYVASLEQTAAKLQQHPDVVQYHNQASQNIFNNYFIGGAALGLCLVAFARVLQLSRQKRNSIQIELATLRASEPSDPVLFA
ncbi:hypothetical protein J4208_01780 [Candidatus Woesearchaeota archaeon]|nr:hypothetical protein [Candidatus Woesearchaeota archaeon]